MTEDLFESSEEWLPVAGFQDLYEVSSMGRVRSLEREVIQPCGPKKTMTRRVCKARILSPNLIKETYFQVSLYRDGLVVYRKVHTLVCEAFHGPKPHPSMQVRHLNGRSTDNRKGNVCWGTAAENEADKKLHGTHQRGSRHAHTDLTEAQVAQIFIEFWALSHGGSRRVPYGTIKGFVNRYGTTVDSVENIVYRRFWRHITDPIAGRV